MAENTYRLHWFDGTTEDVCGPDPATAMNNAGIGRGALRSLDYYETIDSKPDELDRLRTLNAELLAALHRIAYEPIGHPEASTTEVLNGIVEIAKSAVAKAEGENA